MAELMRDSLTMDPENVRPGQHAAIGAQPVEFYLNKVAGKDYCRMVFPGDRQTVWDQPVREKDKQRFWREWDLYQQGKSQTHGQTPLTSWGDIDPGSIAIYKMMHIDTVEQLAAVPDGNFQNFPRGHTALAHRHRDMARTHIAEKQQSAGFDQALDAAAESQKLAETALGENAELRGQLDELQRRIEAGGQAQAERLDEMTEIPVDEDGSVGGIDHAHSPNWRSGSEPAEQTLDEKNPEPYAQQHPRVIAPDTAVWPKHTGGRGTGAKYVLSDGRIVKGKPKAIRAQAKLHPPAEALA